MSCGVSTRGARVRKRRARVMNGTRSGARSFAAESDICSLSLHLRPSRRRTTPPGCSASRKYLLSRFIVTFRARAGKALGGSLVRLIGEAGERREAKGASSPRTVPRNHELMTPGHVSPFSSTLIPPVKTTVFAAAAGAKPGLGFARNAGISSTNGGSARAPVSDRRVRRRGETTARGAPLVRVRTRRSGTAESTRFPPADDTAGVGRRHRAVVPGTEIVVIERPPRCPANARRATVEPRTIEENIKPNSAAHTFRRWHR